MFNKLKQVKDLRNQAKAMQNALSEESVTAEKNGLTIKMNGNLEIVSVNLEKELEKNSLEDAIRSTVNDAVKKTQRIMAKKMQEMGGFPGLG